MCIVTVQQNIFCSFQFFQLEIHSFKFKLLKLNKHSQKNFLFRFRMKSFDLVKRKI